MLEKQKLEKKRKQSKPAELCYGRDILIRREALGHAELRRWPLCYENMVLDSCYNFV
jgi:hypothetical protein